MTGVLKEEFSRAFLNKRFGIVILLACISFAYGLSAVGQIQMDDQALGAVSLWLIILKQGYYGFFAALMAALPFADSLIIDRRHHFVDRILMRARYKHYLAAKICSNVCAGMLAVAGPALILLLICLSIFTGDGNYQFEIPLGVQEVLNPMVIEPASVLRMTAPTFVALTTAMLLAFGASYALLGLAASLVIRDPFVVLGAPFVCYSVGYYLIPTSRILQWLGSTEAALLPSVNLLSAVLQYLAMIIVLGLALWLWGYKEQMLLD